MSATESAGSAQPQGLEFPGAHVLIAMGPADAEFRDGLLAALLAAGARRSETEVNYRLSRTGRYQSVQIEVHVDSREELETLYQVVKAFPGVVFRL
jgi:putative lipoic acid-binding regulatory protein